MKYSAIQKLFNLNPKGKTMSQANENNGRNEIIKNVEIHWAKLDKPVSPFGTEQYEVSLQVPKKRASELEAYGKTKPVKDKEGKDTGKVSINLKKKAFKKDGTEAAKVRVVDTHKQPVDPKTIGNGTIGNVMVYLQDYQIKAPNGRVTKEGTSVMLTAVQVVELVKYEPKSADYTDFDYEEGAGTAAGDDDIPF
jgi:hypothetical protein